MKLKAQRKMEESTYMSFDSLDIDSLTLQSQPSRTPSELDEWGKQDEILLDPEDRPLDLAVNANSAVTFSLVTGSDRTAEVLAGLQDGNFTPSQRRKLMEKFNIDDDMMSSSDMGDTRASQSSASESTGKTDSLDGSPVPNDRRRSKFKTSLSHVKSFGKNKERPSKTHQQSELKNIQHLQNGTSRKSEKTTPILSITTLPKVQNGKGEAKQARRPQAMSKRQGREQGGVSASARRIFSNLRKGTRERSASRERNEKAISTKPEPKDDLSSDVYLPGILKIFGDVVSPGAKYKSVLATRQSKARELVKAALERYGVPRSMGRKYVLCEVVGRIRQESVPIRNGKDNRGGYSVQLSQENNDTTKIDVLDEAFVEDYVRPLNDHEKPLILQSFWKPLEGYARRFELRERSQVLDQINSEKDRETRDVNAQAKRLIIKNARLSRTQSSLSIKMIQPECSSSEDEDEHDRINHVADKKKIPKDEINNNMELSPPTPPTPSQFADHDHDKGMNGDVEKESHDPLPFLLTLQGEEGVSSKDKRGSLVHHLNTKVTVIGRNQSEQQKGGDSPVGTDNDVSIKLLGDDIKPHHCVVYRIKREGSTDDNQSPWKVTLHLVAEDCDVTVNGTGVDSDQEISNGDMISIGSKYIFMLKDPSSKANLNDHMKLTGLNSSAGRLNSIASRGSAFTPVKKRYLEMELNYRPEYEDNVLDVIFAAANDIISVSSSKVKSINCDRELAPARFLIHCIEQSCFNFSSEQKRSLLFVIATNLQTILLDATESVKMQDDSKIKNPEEGINYILPKLEDVVFWMSNSLEIFSYLQSDLVERVKTRVAQEMELDEVERSLLNEASNFRVTDDVLAVLEEIVMYAFQQLVYYLTKTLYGALPKVLDTNPFAEISEDSETVVRGTGHVTAIYEAALGLTKKYGVHPEIESQLFAYLFFFTNVSLFNTLMEDEASSKYYRWDKGVQIRGNLEEIECWANDNGFQDQAAKFLKKFSALTNLLATTKTQMLQSTWSNFRRDFPQLHPVQLRQILDGYVLGPRVRKRPTEWIPDAEDLEQSTEEEQMLESYDNHPPLVLPTDGTQILLDEVPTGPWYNTLRDVVLAVGQGRDAESMNVHEVWRSNTNHNNSIVGERQQPDGREIPMGYHQYVHSSVSSSSASSMASRNQVPYSNNKIWKKKSYSQAEIMEEMNLNGRPHSPSSTSLSSMLSDSASQASMDRVPRENYTYDSYKSNAPLSPTPAPRRGITTPTASPRSPKSTESSSDTMRGYNTSTKYATLDRPKKKKGKHRQVQTDDLNCDYSSLLPHHIPPIQGMSTDSDVQNLDNEEPSEDSFVDVTEISQSNDATSDLRVLPINTTITKRSEIETNTDRPLRSSMQGDTSNAMPNEVFIVDVVKGRKGLGLGLVDGMYTSLQIPGVFVRSLVPDGPNVKHVRMKHQEVIKCWLQDGRLLLGDRILAVNGTSLVSMNYTSAMEELRQAGDRMRFLVGRSGADVAIKITSSSC